MSVTDCLKSDPSQVTCLINGYQLDNLLVDYPHASFEIYESDGTPRRAMHFEERQVRKLYHPSQVVTARLPGLICKNTFIGFIGFLKTKTFSQPNFYYFRDIFSPDLRPLPLRKCCMCFFLHKLIEGRLPSRMPIETSWNVEANSLRYALLSGNSNSRLTSYIIDNREE